MTGYSLADMLLAFCAGWRAAVTGYSLADVVLAFCAGWLLRAWLPRWLRQDEAR